MAAQAQNQQLSPQLFMETASGYQRTAAMKAAVDLDVFTAIGEGASDVPALAKRCAASERGLRILCDYLTVIGFLTKEDGRYALTPDSAAFLSRRSPMYLASAINFIAAPMHKENFEHMTEVVRNGGSISPTGGTTAPEHPIWVEFAESMAGMMRLPAELVAGLCAADASRPFKVLDIAAGHGLFGIAVARHNAQAQIVALDWPQVLEVAKRNAREAGVAARYQTISGSAFEAALGTGYDLVLLTNFLHHFDQPTNEKLLRRVHAALAPGGRAAALEFVPNDDRVSPPQAAGFSFVMLAGTPAGDAYTFREYDSMFRTAGFSKTSLHPLPPTPESVVLAEK